MGKRVIKQSKASQPSASGNCGCGCLPVSKK
jgi:hypothetical protein